MARSSADVQTDINNTQNSISAYNDQISMCNSNMQSLDAKCQELQNEKDIIKQSMQIVDNLWHDLISDINNLEPSSVCIQEIQSTSTVSSEINSKCTSALKTAEIVVLKIDMQIKNAEKEYDEWSNLSSKCQQQKSNCESKLTTLNTEFTQAQEEEALAAAGGV